MAFWKKNKNQGLPQQPPPPQSHPGQAHPRSRTVGHVNDHAQAGYGQPSYAQPGVYSQPKRPVGAAGPPQFIPNMAELQAKAHRSNSPVINDANYNKYSNHFNNQQQPGSPVGSGMNNYDGDSDAIVKTGDNFRNKQLEQIEAARLAKLEQDKQGQQVDFRSLLKKKSNSNRKPPKQPNNTKPRSHTEAVPLSSVKSNPAKYNIPQKPNSPKSPKIGNSSSFSNNNSINNNNGNSGGNVPAWKLKQQQMKQQREAKEKLQKQQSQPLATVPPPTESIQQAVPPPAPADSNSLQSQQSPESQQSQSSPESQSFASKKAGFNKVPSWKRQQQLNQNNGNNSNNSNNNNIKRKTPPPIPQARGFKNKYELRNSTAKISLHKKSDLAKIAQFAQSTTEENTDTNTPGPNDTNDSFVPPPYIPPADNMSVAGESFVGDDEKLATEDETPENEINNNNNNSNGNQVAPLQSSQSVGSNGSNATNRARRTPLVIAAYNQMMVDRATMTQDINAQLLKLDKMIENLQLSKDWNVKSRLKSAKNAGMVASASDALMNLMEEQLSFLQQFETRLDNMAKGIKDENIDELTEHVAGMNNKSVSESAAINAAKKREEEAKLKQAQFEAQQQRLRELQQQEEERKKREAEQQRQLEEEARRLQFEEEERKRQEQTRMEEEMRKQMAEEARKAEEYARLQRAMSMPNEADGCYNGCVYYALNDYQGRNETEWSLKVNEHLICTLHNGDWHYGYKEGNPYDLKYFYKTQVARLPLMQPGAM